MPSNITAPQTSILAAAPCHVTLSCTNLARTRDFYENTLGLPVVDQSDELGIMLSAGGQTRIYIYPRDDPPLAQNTVAAFQVADVRGAVAALRDRGVVFEEYDLPGLKTVDGIATMGNNEGAWFKDPDGNIIGISEQ